MAKRIVISIKNKILSMVKKRAFYAAWVIVFSILLLADIGFGLFVHVQPQTVGDMGDRTDMGMPEDLDMSEITGHTGTGEMPDAGGMPDAGEMPDTGGMNGRPDMNGAGDDRDRTARENPVDTRSGGSLAVRFLYAVKSHWLMISIILALSDITCIVLLVHLTKKERTRQLLELKEKMEADGEVHLIRKPKKGNRHAYLNRIVPVAGLLLAVAAVKFMTNQHEQTFSRTEASIYSAKVETGSISTVLPGTGTLAEDMAETLDLPENVEITEWYVSNGDIVEEGDRLAKVDKVSVMTAIADVQDKLDALDGKMAEHEDDEVSEAVEATAGGRIKAVYAEEDVNVEDTMYEYGALMLISLDGTMAVSIETEEALSVGDAVTVTLSDGTEETGKVESVIGGTAVITITDDGPAYGDVVSVAAEDGTTLGGGELYIHSELKVTGFIGTVTDVLVSVEDEIDAGDRMLTLENTEYIGEYETLADQRAELETEIKTLFRLYEEEYIYAECAGKISGISENDTTSDAAAGLQLPASSDTAGDSSNAEQQLSVSSCMMITLSAAADMEETAGGVKETGETGETGEAADIPTETRYIAVVNDVYYQGIDILMCPETYGMDGNIDQSVLESLTDRMTVAARLKLPDQDSIYLYKDGEITVGNLQDIQRGCLLVLCFEGQPDLNTDAPVVEPVSLVYMEPQEKNSSENGQNQQYENNNGVHADSENAGTDSSAGGEGMSDGGSGKQGTAGGTSDDDRTAAADEAEENYSVTEVTWLSITPQDSMYITISVDEMDILALKVGQEAAVTLDALPGQSFDGVVTSIDRNGTNSGGSSKYTAVITIDRNENMLAGMNASVKIILDTTNDIPVIPTAALVEDETGVYVYTRYDEDSETFGGLTEVTTGVSDGEYVEITSGLSEGSEYWYSCPDVVNYSSGYAPSENGGFSLNSLFGGEGRR